MATAARLDLVRTTTLPASTNATLAAEIAVQVWPSKTVDTPSAKIGTMTMA